MNTTSENNQRHNEALEVVKKFIRTSGKITKAPDNYKGIEWKAPVPRARR